MATKKTLEELLAEDDDSGLLEVKPRASMAMARSSTSISEPKTNGPTSGMSEPVRLKKLLSVSNPRERCAAMMVWDLAMICGRICSVEMMT